MPRPIPNILDAATRCFHLNMALLFPKYIVLRSEKRNAFVISTLHLFDLNHAACPTDDWTVALNLSSEDIMSLMGIIPRKPEDPTVIDELQPEPNPDLAPAGPIGDNSNASSPENL